MTFYVLVAGFGPLAYRICGRLATRQARVVLLAAAVGALGLVSMLYKWWAFYVARIPGDDWPVYFGPVAKLDTFATGMLLAVVVVAGDRFRVGGVAPALLQLVGVSVLVATCLLRAGSTPVGLYVHTLSGVAFALVLVSTVLVGEAGRGSFRQRLLARPLLQFLVLVSYGIYMWHEPILIKLGKRNVFIQNTPDAFLSNALVLTILSITAAALSYGAWSDRRCACETCSPEKGA